MRVAIVKTSSMGDVIHALPVVADMTRECPGVVIDWVVERAYGEIPRWQPAIREVMTVAVRQWRRQPLAARTRSELRAFRAILAHNGPYDLVLDLQGLIKSALIARLVPGPSAGYNFRCARESLAALAYSRRYGVDMRLHAIEKMRQLAAQALGYQVSGRPQFVLELGSQAAFTRNIDDGNVTGPQGLVVLLHASARPEKCWPVQRWRELVQELNGRGIATVLPWASAGEQLQARQIAGTDPRNLVPESVMSLTQCARLLRDAVAVVGVDTGLTHLAAALGCATISVFGATEPERYGPYWSDKAVNLGGPQQWPTSAQVLRALEPQLAHVATA